MKILYGVLASAIVAFGLFAVRQGEMARTSMSIVAEPQATATATPIRQANPNQETNDRFVKQLAEKIAGRENEPAEKVFKNIQIPVVL